jgi:DNA-binding transcriptional ArsR family regulator
MQTVLTVGKALSDANRVRTLMALKTHGELCACKISEFLHITSATVSRHMDVLIAAGLVESRKEGRWVHYRLSPKCTAEPGLGEVLNWVFASLSGDPMVDVDQRFLSQILGCQADKVCNGKVE